MIALIFVVGYLGISFLIPKSEPQNEPQIIQIGSTPSVTANILSTTTSKWISVGQWQTSTDFSLTFNVNLTTTTISSYKRSIYRPTSTDGATYWIRATTSDSFGDYGTPSKIADNSKGNRKYAAICLISLGNPIDIFLTDSTTTDMMGGRGIQLTTTTNCFEIDDSNLWQGAIWGMSSTLEATSTISFTESK